MILFIIIYYYKMHNYIINIEIDQIFSHMLLIFILEFILITIEIQIKSRYKRHSVFTRNKSLTRIIPLPLRITKRDRAKIARAIFRGKEERRATNRAATPALTFGDVRSSKQRR